MRLRFVLGGFCLAAALGGLTLALYVRDWAVCRDEIAQVGSSPTVRTCRPMELTDPPFVLIAIAIVALVVPGISKFAIPGLLEIEREVSRQGTRQDQLASDIADIRMVQSVRQQVVQSVSVGFLSPEDDFGAALRNLSDKEASFRVEPSK